MGNTLEKDDYGSCTNARHDALTTATRSPSKPGLHVAYMHSLCVMWLCQRVNGVYEWIKLSGCVRVLVISE
jgi:hypothetical protein